MKYILITISLFFVSCNNKDYKFKIEGKITTTINQGDFFTGYQPKRVEIKAVAYTDTIHGFNNDSIWFFNSNGSKVCIQAPYTVSEIK